MTATIGKITLIGRQVTEGSETELASPEVVRDRLRKAFPNVMASRTRPGASAKPNQFCELRARVSNEVRGGRYHQGQRAKLRQDLH